MGSAHSAGRQEPGWLHAIVRFGPEILVASLLLVALGVGIRRRWALLPVALGGAVLYVAMYVQSSLTWMYVAIAVGTGLLILAFALSLRPRMSNPTLAAQTSQGSGMDDL